MLSSKTLVLACLLSLQTLAQSSRSKTCNIEPAKGKEDSSAAILTAFKSCSSNAVIVFKEGADYNVLTPLVFPKLNNVEIRVGGNLHLPKDIPAVQKVVAAGGGKIHWFKLTGTNVDWIGSSKPENGWINSYGQQWYDANPAGKGGLPNRPKLLHFAASKSTLQHFKAKKPIGWVVSLVGDDITVSNAIIDAESSSYSKFPFNTDGFAINGERITITKSKIMNGDDAVTIHDGTKNFIFKDSTIGYETHGMSIGSLGKDSSKSEQVSNLLFDNITMLGGLYASRFKSWAGGKGLVKNVTWSNIHITNVTFPAFVTQIYQDQSVAKGPKPASGQSVELRDFTWSNFSGTINSKNPGDGSCISKPCWYDQDLPPLKHNEAVIIQCASEKVCSNFVVKGFKLKTDAGAATSAVCANLGKSANPKLGFKCANGPFIAE
ncbi:glycosyl hydrolase family 28 [Venturia nashicola]|uniref:galacturonan 1,4-alpha-galacturonidase n=1 Tax=Venturia nashicola TaxID=86259 RepID=A0A4Z1P3H1_9PEZI|nr:glycosyl hydrolase family 28 [Venturia nashicola]TLD35004.1 glycosyl hydrolase family 28 [Venturia nashicola]